MQRNLLAFTLLALALTAPIQVGDLRAATAAAFLTAREQANQIGLDTSRFAARNHGLEFERLVQRQYESTGHRVLQTKSPNNMGVDRIATRNGQVRFVQAKAFQSARAGAISGALDALEFYGGNPQVRIPYLRDNTRRFVVSVPADKYAELSKSGLIGRRGIPSPELIELTKLRSSTYANMSGPKAARYRAVAGYERKILSKARFERGPANYQEIRFRGNSAARNSFVNSPSSVGKWLGRAGIVALVATEGYVIQGFATGRLSEREFVTAQSAIVGGGLGAWGGATAGAAAGGAIGVLFFGAGAVPGAAIGGVIGGIAGGFGGAKLGEMAATGFYGRLDEKQKRQVESFIYQRYGVSQ